MGLACLIHADEQQGEGGQRRGAALWRAQVNLAGQVHADAHTDGVDLPAHFVVEGLNESRSPRLRRVAHAQFHQRQHAHGIAYGGDTPLTCRLAIGTAQGEAAFNERLGSASVPPIAGCVL